MLQPAWLNAGITSRRKLTGAGRSMPSTTTSASTSVLPSSRRRSWPSRSAAERPGPLAVTVAISGSRTHPLDRSRGVAHGTVGGRDSSRSSAGSPGGRSTGTAAARPRSRPASDSPPVSASGPGVGQRTDDRQAEADQPEVKARQEGNGVHGWHLRPGGESVSVTSHRVGAGGRPRSRSDRVIVASINSLPFHCTPHDRQVFKKSQTFFGRVGESDRMVVRTALAVNGPAYTINMFGPHLVTGARRAHEPGAVGLPEKWCGKLNTNGRSPAGRAARSGGDTGSLRCGQPAFPDGGRPTHGGGGSMAVRFESGWMRFGLPGLALGLFLASGWGISGEPAAAQAPGSPSRSVTGGVGKGRSAPSASAAGAKGVTSGEVRRDPGPGRRFGPGLADPVALPDRHEEAGLRDLPGRSDQSQGCVKLEASRQFRWDLELDQYNNQGSNPTTSRRRWKP